MAPDFVPVDFGYSRPDAQALVITNTGNSLSTVTSVATLGEAIEMSGYDDAIEIPAGSSDSSLIFRPKEGLDAGNHTVEVIVSYTDGGEATAEVSFTVNRLSRDDAPPAPELESATDSSITLKSMESGDNGAEVEYRVNGGPWQKSPVFKNLNPEREYIFEARYAQSTNFEASEPGESAMFATGKAEPSDPPKNTEVPGTGDSGRPMLWLTLLLLGGAAMPLALRKRKEQ